MQTPSNARSSAAVAQYPRPYHDLVAAETPSYFLELTANLTFVLFRVARV